MTQPHITPLSEPVQDPYPVPAQWAPQTRYMPPPPLGGDMTRVGATEMAELGALLAGMGADGEKGAVTALLAHIQATTIQVVTQHMPTLLGKVREWNRARLTRLYESVERLPEAAPPQGLLSRMAGGQLPVTSLVDRQAVLREIAKMIEQNPVSH